MNKKKLGGIAALSLAAITAVPTFSIVASADITTNVGNIYQVTTNASTGDNIGKPDTTNGTVKYFATKKAADDYIASLSKIEGTNADGTPYSHPGATITNSNANLGYLVPVNGYVIVDATTGEVTKVDTPVDGAIQWTGSNNGGTNTPGGNLPPENPGTTTPGTSISTSEKYSSVYCWYSSATRLYYLSQADAITDTVNKGGSSTSVRFVSPSGSGSGIYSWYSTYTQRYYTTYEDALAASLNNPAYVVRGTYYDTNDYSYSGSLTYRYYSSTTGRYYKTWNDAYVASNYDTTKVSEWNSSSWSSTYSSTYSWYSSYTGRYYQTYAAALAVSPNSSYVSQGSASSSSTYSSTYSWYSSYTKRYYQTYAAALAASNNNSSYVSQGNYYYYNNPYYYYYGLNGYYGLGGLGNTTTTNRDTSSVTIGNLKGWTSVIRTVNSAKSGASYTVNMKTETEIPSNVLTALKGKNVTINFKFSNGAVFSLNGADISSTSAISPVIRYGSTSIPSSLKKKAVKSNDGVSSSQFTINGNSFGADASITVKFNTKRAGCSAKLYRYNASANTLSLVSRSAVQSNGQCKFDNVKQGGEYIVVLS